MNRLFLLGLSLVVGFAAVHSVVKTADAEDWPRWRGLRGDGTWNAPKLAETWSADGLKTVWTKSIGGGYAGVIVSGGKVYNADRLKKPEEVERLQCFDAHSGELLWTQTDSVDYGKLDYGNGPRAAPTVFDGRIYTLGAVGQLNCRQAAGGKLIWSKHLVTDLQGRTPTWGFAASPFIFENTVITSPGGKDGTSIVALDRKTGDTVWKSLSDESTYATPILVESASGKQLICWTPSHIRALDPKSGKLLWSHAYKIDMGVSIATPVFHQGTVLVSGYWHGARALRPGKQPTDVALAWEDKRLLRGLMSQPLCRDGYGYMLSRTFGLSCFDFKTGKKMWDDKNTLTPRANNAQATLVWLGKGDRIIALNAIGELILARLNPQGYHEQARAKIIGRTWAHPAYAGNHVYARSDTELVCVELPLAE